jgi:hypothetical protein
VGKIPFIALLALGIAGLFTGLDWRKSNLANKQSSRPLTVLLPRAPYSFDPLEYDAFLHHVIATPILSTLVSQYRTGKITGVVAESWTNNAEMTEWRFRIRKKLIFENGDPITPAAVAASLNRIVWLLHKRGSQDGLVDYLVGIEKMSSASSPFPGILVAGDEVVFSFTSPRPKLLESISFGIYGITHKNDFDSSTGEWTDPHKAIASGPYRVSAWKEKLSSVLRDDFPSHLRHPSAARQIEVHWGDFPGLNPDIVWGSNVQNDHGPEYEFTGSGALTSNIFYMHLYTWNQEGNVLNSRTCRMHLRAAFYEELNAMGFKPIYSFLPLAIPNIKEFDPSLSLSKEPCAKGKTFPITGWVPSFKPISKQIHDAMERATAKAGGAYQTSVSPPDDKTRVAHLNHEAKSYTFDTQALITGILIEDAEMDLRFMVKSKEGIRLPDPTGQLREVVNQDKVDVARFNQILWDDAIIWPITHMVLGLWIKKGKIDVSLLNLSLPPSDLSLIGVNE